MANAKRKTKRAPARKTAPRAAALSAKQTTAGVLGALCALWLVYATLTLSPFSWGTLAEELILALCALFALRLLCFTRLPNGLIAACLILLPAGIVLYGAYAAANLNADFARALCLAGTAAIVLLTARALDERADGVVLAALLFCAALPVLFAADTLLIEEFARLLLAASVLAAVAALREKAVWFAFLAAGLTGMAGAAGYFAALYGAGIGAALLVCAPKKQKNLWTFAALLAGGLPLAVRLLMLARLPAEAVLLQENLLAPGAAAVAIAPHLLRIYAVGALLFSVRCALGREGAAALPVLFALIGAAAFRLAAPALSPDVWMDAPLLCVLAAVGTAKTGRAKGRRYA
ncbi:MAG TPA: hypothetical protein P5075_02425 [Eubacteriales bacterium]|nr:hypothetical protein [Eubacteriales bacterium]